MRRPSLHSPLTKSRHDIVATEASRGRRSGGADGAHEAYDVLTTMVAMARPDGTCVMVNSALESALRQSRRKLVGGKLFDWFADPSLLRDALQRVNAQQVFSSRFEASLCCHPPGTPELPVRVSLSAIGSGGPTSGIVVEMIENEKQSRSDREQRTLRAAQDQKELLRNLAHEIRNPLGGIRGAAQLLSLEFPSRDATAYTDVVIREVDRLQRLLDRMLAPHASAMVLGEVNVHELCEHVRALILAEYPHGLEVKRDYDVSLPELRGDRERLIQALLNVVRNAAQALTGRIAAGDAQIVLRTRIARQVTLGAHLFRLALEVQVEDNGPGVPEILRERVFQPLVSGREGGCGLGLALAQTFVQQHGGTLDCDSVPGRTLFTLRLPMS